VIVEASLTKHSPVQMLETRPHKRAGRSTSACAPFVRGANFHAQLLNNANLATLGPERYRPGRHFRLFALDVSELDVEDDCSAADVLEAAKAHALAEADTVGTFAQ